MRTASTVADGLFFGEGPRWHEGRLVFSDFYAHAVKAFDPATARVSTMLELPGGGQPSGLGWLPDGRMLVVSMLDRRVLRVEPDGTLVTHADLSGLATFHTNDMVVDGQGRAYVGNFGFDLDAALHEHGPAWVLEHGPGTVMARVDPDGTVTTAAADLRFPNGTVITPDGATLIVAETIGSRLTAFTVGPDGSLTDRRVFAELPGVAPDGICLDAEGAVWVANALGTEVLRVAAGGAILDRVAVSQPVYACMLGGPDRRTLYALTAPSSLASVASAAPNGRIEAIEVDVPGAGWP